MYAKLIDAAIVTTARHLPTGARRLDTGQWVLGLRTADADLVAACGWHPVTDNPPTPAAGEVVERSGVELVDGTPTVVYTVRARTAEEIAAEQQAATDQTERDQARQAVENLLAYVALSAPTAAQRLAFERLVGRVLVRLIRDQYGR